MISAEALAACHARAFEGSGRGWSEAEFTALLAEPGIILVGEERGFALFREAAGEAELLTLATDPAARRQGLAARALAEGLARLRETGIGRVFLEVAEDNDAALALYRAAGFTDCGRRKGYYPRAGGAVDALVLALDLEI